MSDMIDTDILISGGGIAGLIAASAFGAAGFSVLCVDPSAPITTRDAEGSDLRSTAFLQPSRDFLDQAGMWRHFSPHAMPLQIMRIVDAGGVEAVARSAHDFNASDISDLPFGWNLPNWLLRREGLARISELDHVTFRAGVGTKSLLTRSAEARVTLTDGTRVRARLVIAADGRNSPMRKAAGIPVTTLRYGQKALAFAVSHDHPHDNISTEVHRSGGPFTLVPLPDYEGKPSSAVVWMERGPEAERLYALPQPAFEDEMRTRSAELYGPLRLISQRTIWPIISQVAHRLTGERLALVAEAAHVVPPIGAQGLNMSLADMATLLDLAKAAPDRLGEAAMLQKYERARHAEIAARVAGVDALNRASMADDQGLRDLRMKALNSFYSVKPVRQILMRAGLGARAAR
jgi:2-octaprenyl-6-methoxyphenol hydroxylase